MGKSLLSNCGIEIEKNKLSNNEMEMEKSVPSIEKREGEKKRLSKSVIGIDKNIVTIQGLTKKYKDFTLSDISFSVPYGSIVGLVGENGAGKSTIIKAIANAIKKDAGSISVLGSTKEISNECKSKIGFIFDGSNFPEMLTPLTLNNILKRIYQKWDETKYFTMINQFQLSKDKKIKDFSKGMKMKLSVIVAFSHNANLLVLDEVTSGLDPIVRDDILDMLLDFVQNERNSVLISSHITSDLEKIADYIVFINNGELVFNLPKDELIYKYAILKCGVEQFDKLDKQDIVAYRKFDFSYEILVSDRDAISKKYPNTTLEKPTIDEIMLLYVKGERK